MTVCLQREPCLSQNLQTSPAVLEVKSRPRPRVRPRDCARPKVRKLSAWPQLVWKCFMYPSLQHRIKYSVTCTFCNACSLMQALFDTHTHTHTHTHTIYFRPQTKLPVPLTVMHHREAQCSRENVIQQQKRPKKRFTASTDKSLIVCCGNKTKILLKCNFSRSNKSLELFML